MKPGPQKPRIIIARVLGSWTAEIADFTDTGGAVPVLK
jgi:hypothetical protein